MILWTFLTFKLIVISSKDNFIKAFGKETVGEMLTLNTLYLITHLNIFWLSTMTNKRTDETE